MHGYVRADGQIGIRNNVAVVYRCLEARQAAQQIARGIPRGEVIQARESDSYLLPLLRHPNFAAVVTVGTDDADEWAEMTAETVSITGKPAALIRVLADGGSVRAVHKGIRAGVLLLREAENAPRLPISLSKLTIGITDDGSAGQDDMAWRAVEWTAAWLTAKKGILIGNNRFASEWSSTMLVQGQKPAAAGLYRLNQNGIMPLLAAGAHIVLYITGKGSTAGSIAAPLIKVCGSTDVFYRLCDDLDVLADSEAAGRSILEKLADIAAGEPCKAELLGAGQYEW